MTETSLQLLWPDAIMVFYRLVVVGADHLLHVQVNTIECRSSKTNYYLAVWLDPFYPGKRLSGQSLEMCGHSKPSIEML